MLYKFIVWAVNV